VSDASVVRILRDSYRNLRTDGYSRFASAFGAVLVASIIRSAPNLELREDRAKWRAEE